jgi:rRNA processing protein Gar1
MRSLGKLVGWSKSGRWIVRGDLVPPPRSTVVNEDLVVIGRVNDVFGPVSGPYVSVDPGKSKTKASPGDTVYFLTSRDAKAGRWKT